MGRGNIFAGAAGEKAARQLLKRKGYKLLDTNFRTPFGELDIVARRGNVIVFFEVKSRATDSLGPPYLSITVSKKRHLVKNALFYLKRFGLVNSYWRIDVVSVKMNIDYEVETIEIIENAVVEEELNGKERIYDC